jgi:hypothetical protein
MTGSSADAAASKAEVRPEVEFPGEEELSSIAAFVRGWERTSCRKRA